MKGLEKKGSKDNQEKFYHVPSQDNRELQAPAEFMSYAHNLEMEIECLQKVNPELRVVNASFGGRRLQGTVEMPLEDFAESLSPGVKKVEPILSQDIASWPMLQEDTLDTFFKKHVKIYHSLQSLLEKPISSLKQPLNLEKTNHLLKQLPEFNTGVVGLFPWMRHIRSGHDVAEADLTSLKSAIRQIIDVLAL